MKTSSAGKVLSRTAARNSFLINQLATPGLGSIMAGRYVAGIGQLVLALAGFALILAWFVLLMGQVVRQMNDGGAASNSPAWLGESGAVVFVVAWIWSLVTSLSVLRESKANEPPRIGET